MKSNLNEGNIKAIDNELEQEDITVAVSTEVPDEVAKVEKDDKTSFEEFKVLYKGIIDIKCRQDFGDCEDEKLWEDAAKELFLQSKNYILVGDEYKAKEDLDDHIEKIEESLDPEYNYQLLDRLKSDCEYFLGNGNRNEKDLWAGNVNDQIAKMKEIYNSLEEKPEWLTMEEIDDYAAKMNLTESVDKNISDEDIEIALKDYLEKTNGLFTDDSIYDIVEALCNESDIDKMPVELINRVKEKVEADRENAKVEEKRTLPEAEIEQLRKNMRKVLKDHGKFDSDEELEDYIEEFMPMWIEAQENLGEPVLLDEAKEDIDYTKFIYELVGGEHSGTYTFEEIKALPEFLHIQAEENEGRREELQHQPILKSYLGPMYNGEKDGKPVIRYETQEVYNALSESKQPLEEAKFFNLYNAFNELYGISKKSPKELIQFFNSLNDMDRISEKDYNIMIDYANKWQALIDETGYMSTVFDESKEVITEDQYEMERRKGRPNLDKIAKEVFEYDNYYVDVVDNFNTEREFIIEHIAEIAAEYNLKEQAAWAVMEKIYKMAKEAKETKLTENDKLTVYANELTDKTIIAELSKNKIYELNYDNGKKDLVKIFDIVLGQAVCKSLLNGDVYRTEITDMIKDGRLIETSYEV